MSFSSTELAYYAALDQKLVEAARAIKVLSALGWPAHVYDEFMAHWRTGNPKLPRIELPKVDLQERRRALAQLMMQADPGHPLGRYVIQTAASYVIAARMLESVGKREFRQFSEMLYGTPQDKLGRMSNLALAEDFIKITADFAAAVEQADAENQVCILPETVAAELKARADAFFTERKLNVVIDKDLASKAAAGSERVRIRGMTSFSRAEIDQLLEHEVFVHSATMRNGRAQPHLKSLGLGSPRTTCAQEGLATFAELITTTMDLSRLRRIALRIKAVDVALNGGSFIDVFRFFLGAGQNEKESFQSTARIFRGGDVRGSHVFTKDVVYLKGLFAVHTFLSKAIEMRKLDYPQYLFIGRLALGDVVTLEPFIQDGFVRKAPYLPKWVANREGLAAYLSYSAFTRHLDLSAIQLADFLDDTLPADPKDLDVPASA